MATKYDPRRITFWDTGVYYLSFNSIQKDEIQFKNIKDRSLFIGCNFYSSNQLLRKFKRVRIKVSMWDGDKIKKQIGN